LDEDGDTNIGTRGTFAHITSPTPSASELFTPLDDRTESPPPKLPRSTLSTNQTPLPTQNTPFPMNSAPVPQTNPTLPFNANAVNTSDPTQSDMVQNLINQMMSSPQSMQRLVQALQNSNFPIQPPSSSAQPVTMSHPNNQLTTYSPAQLHFNFDHQDPTPSRPILLPAPSSSTSVAAAAHPSSLITPPQDELLPALNEQEARLDRSWESAQEVEDSVNLMDSNIQSFMDQFGEATDLDNVHIDPTNFDFEDLLNQFSNDGNFDDLGGGQIDTPVPLPVMQTSVEESKEDKETEKLTAFLDEVASETNSVQHQQLSPEAPIKNTRRKRKSEVV